MKKLALVWESVNLRVAIPLEEVTQEVYTKYTELLGKPKGKTEEFTNLMEVEYV